MRLNVKESKSHCKRVSILKQLMLIRLVNSQSSTYFGGLLILFTLTPGGLTLKFSKNRGERRGVNKLGFKKQFFGNFLL